MLMLSPCCWQRTNLIIFTFVRTIALVFPTKTNLLLGFPLRPYIDARALHNELIFFFLFEIRTNMFRWLSNRTTWTVFYKWTLLTSECTWKKIVHKKNPKVILIQEQTSDHEFLENELKNSLKLLTCLKNAFRLLFQRKKKKETMKTSLWWI